MNYQEWEKTQSFSSKSLEASIAEAAWIAAVEEMRRMIHLACQTETTSAGLAMMLDLELDALLLDDFNGRVVVNDKISEDEIRDYLTDRIESGDLPLEDITRMMARYGLMDPKEFCEEMAERMQNDSPSPGM